MYHTPALVLSVLIARASGQPFETFLRERIFEPLDMLDTAFSVPAEKLDRLGNLYLTDYETGALSLYDAPDGEWSRPPAFPNGGDGLASTADDYLAFAEMLLRGGAPILSRPSVETMTTDHLTAEQKLISGFDPPHDFDGHGWGFGVGVVTRRDSPSAPVGQYGWAGGMGTIWGNDPSEDMATILMTSASFSSPQMPAYARDFLAAAYAAITD
jgi:CubicO group peptidase (beta-lactamase class C family)